MTNLETIQFLYSNYKKFFKNSPNKAITEDCLQRVALSLMKVDYEIESPEKFIRTSLFNELKAYHSKNKRYELVDLPQDIAADCIISQIHEEQEFQQNIESLKSAIPLLPGKQKVTIENFLITGKVTDRTKGVVNTQKAHYWQAVKRLKEILT